DVVRTPVVDDRGQLGLRCKGAHVGTLAETANDAAFLGNLQGSRAVGVLGDHVDALVDHGASRVSFLGRVVPARDVDGGDREVRVHLAGGQNEGVDAHHDFRDRERTDVTSLAGLGEVTSNGAANG